MLLEDRSKIRGRRVLRPDRPAAREEASSKLSWSGHARACALPEYNNAWYSLGRGFVHQNCAPCVREARFRELEAKLEEAERAERCLQSTIRQEERRFSRRRVASDFPTLVITGSVFPGEYCLTSRADQPPCWSHERTASVKHWIGTDGQQLEIRQDALNKRWWTIGRPGEALLRGKGRLPHCVHKWECLTRTPRPWASDAHPMSSSANPDEWWVPVDNLAVYPVFEDDVETADEQISSFRGGDGESRSREELVVRSLDCLPVGGVYKLLLDPEEPLSGVALFNCQPVCLMGLWGQEDLRGQPAQVEDCFAERRPALG